MAEDSKSGTVMLPPTNTGMGLLMLIVAFSVLAAMGLILYSVPYFRGGDSGAWLVWGTAGNLVICLYLALFVRFVSSMPQGRFVFFCSFSTFILQEVAVIHFVAVFGSNALSHWYLSAVYAALFLASVVNSFVLTMGKVRPLAYRMLFAFPYSVFMTSLFFMFLVSPFVAMIPIPYSILPWGCAVLLGLTGLRQTLIDRELKDWETATLAMGEFTSSLKGTAESGKPKLLDVPRGVYGLNPSPSVPLRANAANSQQALRIVQLTDLHVGSTMTPSQFPR